MKQIPHEPHRWGHQDNIPELLLVKPLGDLEEFRRFVGRKGAELGRKIGSQGGYEVLALREKSEALAADLLKAKRVLYAQPDVLHHASYIPTDSSWSSGGALEDYQHAWDLQRGGSVQVGVIDSGCNTFADLGTNILAGWNVLGNNTTVTDNLNHGTACCSLIAADFNNGATGNGVAGIGAGIKVVPVKANNTGSQSNSNTVLAIDWLLTNSTATKIMNISYAGPSASSQALQDEITAAWNAGCIVCVSSGDTDDTVTQYPAALTNAVAVAATNDGSRNRYFANVSGGSSYGAWMEASGHIGIAATGIWSAYDRNGALLSFQATSASCPSFCGGLALLWSFKPSLTNSQLLTAVLATADPVTGSDWGSPAHPAKAFNAYRAMDSLRSDPRRASAVTFGGF